MDVYKNSRTIYPDLLKLIRERVPCALATVTGATGSAPQVPGSSAIVGRTGLLAGTVGGGVVEFQIIRSAMKQLETGQSGYLHFNLGNDDSLAGEAICGGNMSILVDAEPVKHAGVFSQISESLRLRKQGVLITEIKDTGNNQVQIGRYWFDGADEKIPDRMLISTVTEMFSNRKQGDFRELRQTGPDGVGQTVFCLETIVPPQQLIIAGAGHVGKAVSHLGKLLGFEVTVWDDRTEFANREALPDADQIVSGPFSEAAGKITVSPDSYLVIATRGHKNDAEVLKEWIGSEASYIGMIGSRTKIGLIREKFILNGWATLDQWNRIHSPIGLPIGSKTVQEIAVSIAAQLIQERNKKQNHG